LDGKFEGKRPIGRPRHRRENKITLYLRERGWKFVDCMHISGYGPMAGLCEHGNEPWGYIKGGKFLTN